jgi:hypothetical protein
VDVLLTVPLQNGNLPWYQFRANFSGTIFTIHVRYNVRMQRYIMDINDSSDNTVLAGIPILIERNLTGQYPSLSVPEGIFFATDDSGQGNQPTQFSFGVDHTLWYVDPSQ